LSRSQAFGSERLYNVSMSHASDATIAQKHPWNMTSEEA
jgi:hypothetical protein